MKRVKTLLMTVAAVSMTASIAFANSVNVNINGVLPPVPVAVVPVGYLPPPPGVQVISIGGRPCYRESGRIVYLEKDRHYKGKRGHAYGHRKHDHEGHGEGHGNGHGNGHGHGGRH